MNKKFCSMLGISKKAGKLVSGSYNVEKFIKIKKLFLVIFAMDTSENTAKNIKRLCENYNIDYIFYGNKEILGKCIGRELIAVIGITDEGLSKVLLNAAKEKNNDGGE